MFIVWMINGKALRCKTNPKPIENHLKNRIKINEGKIRNPIKSSRHPF